MFYIGKMCWGGYLFRTGSFYMKLTCNSLMLSGKPVRLAHTGPLCFLRLNKACKSLFESNGQAISTCTHCQQIELRKKSGDEISPSTRTQKAKQAAKDTSYGLIIVVGIASMGFVFYVLYKELLSKAGPTQVFGDALEKCRNNQDLTVALGTPLEGYGETNSRGRRRHVSHLSYIDSHGRDAMRMSFYVKGSSGRTGTIQVDSVIVGRKISYRYIIAYLDTYPRRIIIVLDERSELDKESETPLEPIA